MKRIDLVIPHERLMDVNQLLYRHGVDGITFYEVKGRGRTKKEPVEVGRGVSRSVPEFSLWTKVEILVPDEQLAPIIQETLQVMNASSAASGKVFVYNVNDAHNI